MSVSQHPAASHHVPWFITAPGHIDILYVLTAIILIGSVFLVGVFFFYMHSLPERLGHKKLQFEIVAVLGLISLFTHIHLFWVIALILALIDFPDFITPLQRIAKGVEDLSAGKPSAVAGSGDNSSADRGV